MSKTLFQKYRSQIDAIVAPDEFDCRNLLTGRTMHFIAESGISFTPEEIDQLTHEAMREQQAMDRRNDQRSRGITRFFRA